MPQLFQVLKCYKCAIFQVHQTKKSNKWECKMCGEKQSIKRHYGLGTGKECRLHVQKLNGIRGDIDEANETLELNKSSDEEIENCTPNKEPRNCIKRVSSQSKWENFIDKTELEPESDVNEAMYLDNTEVVLEVPVKKRKKFIPPTTTPVSELSNNKPNNESNEMILNYELAEPRHVQNHVLKSCETSACNSIFKTNSYKAQTIFNPKIAVIENLILKSEASDYRQDTDNWLEQSIQNENQNKVYVPPKVNANSKWAEFTDDPDDNIILNEENVSETESSIQETSRKPPKRENLPSTVTKKIFQLCDDSELDDILDF